MQFNKVIQSVGNLPALAIADAVNKHLTLHSNLVITAPPGAGKSTILPLSILQGMKGNGKILMLEPRRLAARHIAERMAELLNEPVGKTVGYRVRFESKVSKDTRIEVLTEGILTRMIIEDATLDGVDVIIFDEFHERSINADLALALTRQSQQIIRDDLKIVIMSATIDATQIAQSLHAPLIESKGRMFPVKIVHTQQQLNPNELCETVTSTIRKAHKEQEGDILVFLPGQADITKCMNLLGESLLPTQVYPLYGNLSTELQRKAIAPSKLGERKVVLATPIAETSVTIEGVRIVIDTGLYRKQKFDARTGLSHLETVRISHDMATQRTGRAGRVAEGFCFRLWPLAVDHQMEEQRKAEILETDLTSTLLSIAAFGENDITSLPWLTPPPTKNVANAQLLLQLLGATDSRGCITPLGKKMANLPCHPRIARMIICAQNDTLKALACDIAAILEEKDPMNESNNADLSLRISQLRLHRQQNTLGRWKRIAQIAKEYRQLAHVKEDNCDIAPEWVGALVAYAYPERIATATNGIGNYRLATGDNVCVEGTDIISSYQWISIASLHSAPNTVGRVFMAAPLNINDLDETFVTTRKNITWNTKQGCVVALEEKRIGQITISATPLQGVDKEAIIQVICQAAEKNGLSMLNWSDDVKRMQQRIERVAEWHPELELPNISTQHLLSVAQSWLPFYLILNGKIITTTSDLKKIDLCQAIWSLIPYNAQLAINHFAPTHIEVPTGSRIRIDYRNGAEAPILSVRLQECFGLKDTPCVNDGKQPVLMELLSPGFKPVQLTQDLRSFWENTYFDIRKELRRRYPKHYWPENPLEAEAVKGVKRNRK